MYTLEEIDNIMAADSRTSLDTHGLLFSETSTNQTKVTHSSDENLLSAGTTDWNRVWLIVGNAVAAILFAILTLVALRKYHARKKCLHKPRVQKQLSGKPSTEGNGFAVTNEGSSSFPPHSMEICPVSHQTDSPEQRPYTCRLQRPFLGESVSFPFNPSFPAASECTASKHRQADSRSVPDSLPELSAFSRIPVIFDASSAGSLRPAMSLDCIKICSNATNRLQSTDPSSSLQSLLVRENSRKVVLPSALEAPGGGKHQFYKGKAVSMDVLPTVSEGFFLSATAMISKCASMQDVLKVRSKIKPKMSLDVSESLNATTLAPIRQSPDYMVLLAAGDGDSLSTQGQEFVDYLELVEEGRHGESDGNIGLNPTTRLGCSNSSQPPPSYQRSVDPLSNKVGEDMARYTNLSIANLHSGYARLYEGDDWVQASAEPESLYLNFTTQKSSLAFTTNHRKPKSNSTIEFCQDCVNIDTDEAKVEPFDNPYVHSHDERSTGIACQAIECSSRAQSGDYDNLKLGQTNLLTNQEPVASISQLMPCKLHSKFTDSDHVAVASKHSFHNKSEMHFCEDEESVSCSTTSLCHTDDLSVEKDNSSWEEGNATNVRAHEELTKSKSEGIGKRAGYTEILNGDRDLLDKHGRIGRSKARRWELWKTHTPLTESLSDEMTVAEQQVS